MNGDLNEKVILTGEQEWTTVIKPRRKFFQINFREIWQYRDLIQLFIRRDIVARFKQTVLGPLWFVLGPILSTLVYIVVFNNIARIPTDGVSPTLFYLTGIVGWNYFAACLNGTSTTFTANASIFGKVYFPRLVTPIATVLSNLVLFLIQFGLLLILMLVFHLQGKSVSPGLTLILIPVYLFILAGTGLGTGIIISSLTTKYRDLTQLMSFGVQLWMYATPIIYPVSAVPEQYRRLILINPIAPVIENFKYSLLGSGMFNLNGLYYSIGFAIVIMFIGILVFNKVERNFMDTV